MATHTQAGRTFQITNNRHKADQTRKAFTSAVAQQKRLPVQAKHAVPAAR